PVVGERAAGDAHLESLAVRQGVARHEAAVAPAPKSNPASVHIRLTLQPGQAVFKIAQLQWPKVFVDRPLRLRTLPTRRAVVANPNDVTLLRHHLMPHVGRAAPTVSHLWRMRSAVGELEHRVFLR